MSRIASSSLLDLGRNLHQRRYRMIDYRSLARLLIAVALLIAAAQGTAKPGDFSLGSEIDCVNGQPRITLNWTASSGATSYAVFRDLVQIATTTSLSYADTNVITDTDYSYFIRATDGATTTDSATITVGAPSCVPPGAFNLTATAICTFVGQTRRPVVHLSWTDSGGAFRYDVFRDGVVLAQNVNTDTTTFDDTSGDVGSAHTYSVKANNSTTSNSVTTSAPPSTCPAPPGGLSLSGNAGCDASSVPKQPFVALSWTAASGAAGYDVIRNGEVIVSTASTAFTDSAVTAGQSYTYIVRASNNGGSTDSNPLTVGVASDICGQKPGVFTLTATPSCPGGAPRIGLSWTASSSATSYVVFRNATAVTGTLPASTLAFTDSDVAIGTSYQYGVVASNDSGSTDSNTAAATVTGTQCGVAPVAPVLSGSSVCIETRPAVRLSWSPSSDEATYAILRNGSQIGTTPGTAFDDTNVAAGQSFNYVVRAGTLDSNTVNVSVQSCGGGPVTGPDLAVPSVTLSATTASSGDALTVLFTISNSGTVSVPATTTRIRIGSGPDVKASDFVLAAVPTPALAAGASTPISSTVDVPPLASGPYFVFVTADDGHVVNDVNLANNVGRSPVLQVGSCTLSCATTVAAKVAVLVPAGFALAQPPACNALTVLWDFGDGVKSSNVTTSHVYEHPGSYHWTVSATSGTKHCDNGGTIEVQPLSPRVRAVRH